MSSLKRLAKNVAGLCVLSLALSGCRHAPNENGNATLEEVAGSEEALDFMKTFSGRGTLSDSSMPTPALDAVTKFRYPDDLTLDLVLSEPEVTQPVFLNFDSRGRLWVVQYNQYPYPKGSRVMNMDQHMRAQYDKIPQPPPDGAKGADKISFFEDTDGDGEFDKVTHAVEGLNITTSVAFGRGHIWVLAPPYLLVYPDKDGDGMPDGRPVVHLEGFGIEDTHAVANNLRWGPDGWLYGAQGSTCNANVSSSVSRNVKFNGQAIWRYHPESHIFEVFAEGGGNTFDVEIDDKGRLYSGDNGASRGRYYKQGAYHVRSLGKHGLYTNPYAFGHLSDMELTGDNKRFTHAFIRYEEQSLPARYHGRMIAINPLQSYVQLSSFEPKGSTFSNVDAMRILETEDHWFRPVDITTGPDGAVYLADWYDSRISHVDPRDTWDKKNGRIYRLRNKSSTPAFQPFNIASYSNAQLIETLADSNRWFRQQAMIEFGNRNDISVVPQLMPLLKMKTGQIALEALWAISLSGGFTEAVAVIGLHHEDPFVRMWTVRLLGDEKRASQTISSELAMLASRELHPEVRSQLASTAKRLPGPAAIPVIKNLLANKDDTKDADIPLLLWWALESKATSDTKAILAMFADGAVWNSPIVTTTILERLTQRWVMEGGSENYAACATMLKLAPSAPEARPLINGIQEGLRGKNVAGLSPDLLKALEPFQAGYAKESLVLALRQGNREAITKALAIIADPEAEVGARLSYIRVFGEIDQPQSVPVLLQLMESRASSGAIKQASLEALSRYSDDEIGTRITKAYPDILRSDPYVRDAALSTLALRSAWAVDLLNAIDRKKKPGEEFVAHTIDKADVNEQVARQLTFLNDPAITETVNRLWPDIKPVSSSDKRKRIDEINKILQSGTGNELAGHGIFTNRCGSCHRLFGEGSDIGPDLTGYERRNVSELLINIIDPNAYIREGYSVYHIKTTDKRSLVGTMKSQTGSSVTIQPFNGELITLGLNQVDEMVEQKISIMPEGLLNGLTDQQVRDVVSYITKGE